MYPSDRQNEFSYDPDSGGWSLSQTAINRFRMCPEKARIHWSGETPDPPGVQAVAGTAAHLYMEHVWDDPAAATERVAAFVADEFASRGGSIPPDDHPWSRDPYTVTQVGYRAGAAIHAHLPERPLLAESRLKHRFPYSTHPVWLHGSPDFVRDYWTFGNELVVTDFKVSAGRQYRPSSAWELHRYAVQPTVYTWLVSMLTGVPLEKVGFQYVVVNPSTFAVHTIDVSRTEADLVRLGREIDAIIDIAKSDMDRWPLRTNDWHCAKKWCPAFDACIGRPHP